MRKNPILASCLTLIVSPVAMAGSDIFFTPLTESAPVSTPDSPAEMSAAFVAPAGVTLTKLTSMNEIEADMAQSVVRAPGAGSGASMWDMVAFDKFGENIFIPHETPWGAGASRYNIATDSNEVMFHGDSNGMVGDWSNDWAAFDPATFTPNGSVLVAEEWSGEGRVLEVVNPHSFLDAIEVRELDSIANVSHEGLRFSADSKTLYFVDEWNSGSIYKIEFTNKNRYEKGGRTFVLVVDAFNGDPAANFNEGSNPTTTRTGPATWVPITDKKGAPLTPTNPFKNGPTADPRTEPNTRGGRAAADEVNGTPYGRPEDAEVGTLANGHTVVYFAATSEHSVYSVEELGGGRAIVRVFVSPNTPKNVGFPATTAVLQDPDNLAQDALGNIFIIEDAPNASAVGGDTWFARDVNNDGVAESLDHFLSIVVDGSEATGMIFNPATPTNFVAAVQHPDSTGVLGGTGDALWSFDVSNVASPAYCAQAEFSDNSGCNYVEELRRATASH